MDGSTEIIEAWLDPVEDELDRGKYAKYLTDLLRSKGGEYVLNLNSPWGLGKIYIYLKIS